MHVLPVLHLFDEIIFEKLTECVAVEEYQKGHIICNQNEEIIDFIIVQEGEVKVLFLFNLYLALIVEPTLIISCLGHRQ